MMGFRPRANELDGSMNLLLPGDFGARGDRAGREEASWQDRCKGADPPTRPRGPSRLPINDRWST
jgi:hypothetical protein